MSFLIAGAVGGLAQIFGTFLLVYLFSFRNFAVGTAYSKTEPIQAALFGFLLLGEKNHLGGCWINPDWHSWCCDYLSGAGSIDCAFHA